MSPISFTVGEVNDYAKRKHRILAGYFVLFILLFEKVESSRLFSCEKLSPGFYADVSTDCQVYHVCDMQKRAFTFRCSPGTKFHQQTLSCAHFSRVECSDSQHFFHLNKFTFRDAAMAQMEFLNERGVTKLPRRLGLHLPALTSPAATTASPSSEPSTPISPNSVEQTSQIPDSTFPWTWIINPEDFTPTIPKNLLLSEDSLGHPIIPEDRQSLLEGSFFHAVLEESVVPAINDTFETERNENTSNSSDGTKTIMTEETHQSETLENTDLNDKTIEPTQVSSTFEDKILNLPPLVPVNISNFTTILVEVATVHEDLESRGNDALTKLILKIINHVTHSLHESVTELVWEQNMSEKEDIQNKSLNFDSGPFSNYTTQSQEFNFTDETLVPDNSTQHFEWMNNLTTNQPTVITKPEISENSTNLEWKSDISTTTVKEEVSVVQVRLFAGFGGGGRFRPPTLLFTPTPILSNSGQVNSPSNPLANTTPRLFINHFVPRQSSDSQRHDENDKKTAVSRKSSAEASKISQFLISKSPEGTTTNLLRSFPISKTNLGAAGFPINNTGTHLTKNSTDPHEHKLSAKKDWHWRKIFE